MKKIELLAPAGDFQIAVTAINNGADAIYAGLSKFSARKAATNLTLDEVQRLKSLAIQKNKKIYITVNTIIPESDFDELFQSLLALDAAEVDGVIIQDIGLISFIKNNFPNMKIHASTQMAIHNSSGIKIMKELGLKRVVLSRELTFENIRKLRTENPNIELETFIHGALCYSFSGMCLASGILLNRSGNSGSCAQICRSYFNLADSKTSSYYFSCRDLCLGKMILKLKQINIDSLKIEGRMKTNDYVKKTIRFYRAILDNDGLSDDQYQKLSDDSAIAFSRKRTYGYFNDRKGENLIDNTISNHQGVCLGIVDSLEAQKIRIKLYHDLKAGSTLMYFKNVNNIIRFQAFDFHKATKSAKLSEAFKNDIVMINLPNNVPTRDLPSIGDPIFLIEVTSDREKIVDHKKFVPHKKQIPINVVIQPDFIDLKSEYFKHHENIKTEQGKNKTDFKEILNKYFAQSDRSLFELYVEKVVNQTQFANLFVKPSDLKKLKNTIYQIFQTKIDEISPIYQCTNNENFPKFSKFSLDERITLRSNLNPERGIIPFASIRQIETMKLESINGFRFLPLMPILPNEQEYFDCVTRLIENNPDIDFAIGINNLSHLELVKITDKYPNVFFFLDFYSYVANFETMKFYKNHIPRLLFAYGWVENKPVLENTVEIKDKGNLPLFISLGCFCKGNFFKDCPKNCVQDYKYELINNRKKYNVVIRDCISYLYERN